MQKIMNAKKEAVARPLSVATASFRLQIFVSGQGLDGGVKRADGIDGAGLVGFVRAFDESAEDVAWAAFDKPFAMSLRRQASQRTEPQICGRRFSLMAAGVSTKSPTKFCAMGQAGLEKEQAAKASANASAAGAMTRE